jgi:hypothetical protein
MAWEGGQESGEARRPASRNVWWRRQIPQALKTIFGVWGFLIKKEERNGTLQSG